MVTWMANGPEDDSDHHEIIRHRMGFNTPPSQFVQACSTPFEERPDTVGGKRPGSWLWPGWWKAA